jgi:uncharacterized protein YkwD
VQPWSIPFPAPAAAAPAVPRSAADGLRLTRRGALAGLAGGAAALALPTAARPADAATGGDLGALLWRLVSERRIAAGLRPLPEDGDLSAVAGSWSARMAAGGGLAHNGARMAEYGWSVADDGEVVGYARDSRRSPAELAEVVVGAWMASSSHRAILLGSWTDIGVGWHLSGDGTLWATAITIAAALPGPAAQAVALSRDTLPGGSAPRVVLARCDVHVDSLAAAGLAGPDAPLLLVRPDQALAAEVVEEVARVCTPGARAFLVGGALHAEADRQLAALGLEVVRLAGPDRYATAAAVARRVMAERGTPGSLLLVRADQWADGVSVAGHAALHGIPILLVDRDAVPAPTAEVRAALPDAWATAVGGPAAVGTGVLDALRADRLGGEDRAGTGAAAMRALWGRDTARHGDAVAVTPGWAVDGWASALAFTTWCARHAAPLLFASDDGVPPAVAAALAAAGYPTTGAVIAFGRGVGAGARQAYQAALAR